MTEVLNPDHVPQSDIPETGKSRQETALEKIFSLLDEDARRHKKPVTGTIRSIPIPMNIGRRSVTTVLRINPALETRGQLNTVVLDFYQDGEGHTQQWVIGAVWKDGKPRIIGVDDSEVLGNTAQFGLTEILEYAGTAIREKLDTEAVMMSSGGIIPLPIINTDGRLH